MSCNFATELAGRRIASFFKQSSVTQLTVRTDGVGMARMLDDKDG
jgi:hypothetical protein